MSSNKTWEENKALTVPVTSLGSSRRNLGPPFIGYSLNQGNTYGVDKDYLDSTEVIGIAAPTQHYPEFAFKN